MRRSTDWGDTNILHRSHTQRRPSAQAVEAWRRGEANAKASATGQGRPFAREIYLRHCRRVLGTRFSNLIVTLTATVLAQFVLGLPTACGWGALMITLALVSGRIAEASLTDDGAGAAAKTRRRKLLHVQIAVGLGWAALLLVAPLAGPPAGTGAQALPAVLFAAAILLSGQALLTQHDLDQGIAVTAFPSVIVVCAHLVRQGSVIAFALALVLVIACLFALNIGERLRQGFVDHMSAEAERDRLIVELEEARQTSEEARRRAEDANLAKSRFLATMSHELRTPLNAILGFSEVMKDEVMGPIENDFYRDYANDIHSSGTHLLKLINEILDLSRVEAGRYELQEEATSLALAAHESQQMLKVKAGDKSIELVVQIQTDLPPVWADARAMRQVILNLLSNALKFTPVGGTIWLKVGWTSGGGQYISVKDNGPGIPEEEIPVVLSSFGQGSIAIKSAEQGTGLGLPIVQALVQMHEGTFTLHSKLRQGTEAIAIFPKRRVLQRMETHPVTSNGRPVVNAPSILTPGTGRPSRVRG